MNVVLSKHGVAVATLGPKPDALNYPSKLIRFGCPVEQHIDNNCRRVVVFFTGMRTDPSSRYEIMSIIEHLTPRMQ